MDDYSRAWYELKLRNEYLERRGAEFQLLFVRIMSLCHPNGDFIPTRPWGNIGDRKNDGYLKSMRTLFQVYAPDQMNSLKTITKIDEDFFGALPFWREHFDIWVFVHNARDGLSPDVEQKLLDLEGAHQHIRLRHWWFPDLRGKIFSLSQTDIASLLGPIPSRTDILNIQVPELSVIVQHIAGLSEPPVPDLRPPSPRKLLANGLSPGVRFLLSVGMVSGHRVGEFFNGYHDLTLGDRVAAALTREYERLRNAGTLPDNIFASLQAFVCGSPPAPPARQATALVILAYLFEECDIFERPPEVSEP